MILFSLKTAMQFTGYEFLPVIGAAAQSLSASATPAVPEEVQIALQNVERCLEAVSSSARMQRLCTPREGDQCPEEAEVIQNESPMSIIHVSN